MSVMKKRLIRYGIGLLLCSLTWPCFAANLIQVFHDALEHDPSFKAQEAEFLANKQLIPISRAALLPNISSSGSITYYRVEQRTGVSTGPVVGQAISNVPYNDTNQTYNLTISQSLFNYSNWMKLKYSKAQVKQAAANYFAACQNLMVQVTQAYFAILQSYDTLLATQAQKRSLAEQLRQTEEQFKVGVVPVTNVDQIKASYDATVAQEIANINTVADNLEALRAMTGVFYTNLAGIKNSLPLVAPHPNNINSWARISTRQNYNLQAYYWGMIAARENVKVQRGDHFPTITANAGGSYVHDSNFGSGFGSQTTNKQYIGVSYNLPIYSGGLITAQTRQASYQYAEAAANWEQTYRNTLSTTRQSYLGVISGASKVKADRQSIVSNQSSLAAIKAGYNVGANTITDILVQLSNLYSAQTTFATDQYNYIVSLVTLKQSAGTLNERDLRVINSWLGKRIDFSEYNFDRTRGDRFPNEVMEEEAQSYISSNKSYEDLTQKATAAATHKKKDPPAAPAVTSSAPSASNATPNGAPSRYTIQLYSSKNEIDAYRFIQSNELEEASYSRTAINGVDVYTVELGNYPTRDQAEAVFNQLPPELKQNNPMIKPIEPVANTAQKKPDIPVPAPQQLTSAAKSNATAQ